MTDPSTSLQPIPPPAILVANRATGELVDLVAASDAELVEIIAAIGDERDGLRADEQLVHEELLHRLDRAGLWTLHVREDREAKPRTWTVKAPSPAVGTTRVDPELLRTTLAVLLAEHTITPGLASAALRRTVTITATVPPSTDLEALRTALRGLDAINGVPVTDVTVSTAETVAAAGCNRLRKAGHGEAVDAATVPAVPAPRRVTVKPVLP